MKEQKGITLIALVITIIVLLILAGVTIAMLVGQNGILTNSNKASCENVYRSADEQMRLAYMAVRTEIMAQTVKTSTYDARAVVANIAQKQVKADLGSDFTVKYVEATKDSNNKLTSDAYIYIQYSSSKLDKDLIETGKPQNDNYSYGKITIEAQSATYEIYDAAGYKAIFDGSSANSV